MVLQVFVQSYMQLLILRLIIGFFDAAIFIGNMKLIFGWFPQSRRGAVVGMILAAYSLAITMDFALGIPLTLATNWRVFFAVLAAGTLIVALLDAIFVKAGPAANRLSPVSPGRTNRCARICPSPKSSSRNG